MDIDDLAVAFKRGMAELKYQCWSKAIQGVQGPPQYSVNWALARRAHFKIFSDRVECGDWVIESADVRNAVLFEARQWFIPVFVLSVETSKQTYQFGFNPWARVDAYLPFEFQREKVRLRYSAFSMGIRIALLAYLAYYVWRWVSKS